MRDFSTRKDQLHLSTQFKLSKAIQSSVKTPDLFKQKEDLPLHDRKLRRWSQACGIDAKLQGDIILFHPSSANPALHDRELEEKLQSDAAAVLS